MDWIQPVREEVYRMHEECVAVPFIAIEMGLEETHVKELIAQQEDINNTEKYGHTHKEFDERAHIQELQREGENVDLYAQQQMARVDKRSEELGLRPENNDSWTNYEEQEIEECYRYYEAGEPIHKIATYFGLEPHTVANHIEIAKARLKIQGDTMVEVGEVVVCDRKSFEYGVILTKRNVTKQENSSISHTYSMSKVKYKMNTGKVFMTQWLETASLRKHETINRTNLCLNCIMSKKYGWEYDMPICKPQCAFKEETTNLDDDTEYDVLCHCGNVAYEEGLCVKCFRKEEDEKAIELGFDNADEMEHYQGIDSDSQAMSRLFTGEKAFLKDYYNMKSLLKYRDSQRIGLKARRLIARKFKKYRKMQIKECGATTVYRQVYTRSTKKGIIWGEIDAIKLRATDELLRVRVTFHTTPKDGTHEMYDGYGMGVTQNTNEVHYRIDGPMSRMAIVSHLKGN